MNLYALSLFCTLESLLNLRVYFGHGNVVVSHLMRQISIILVFTINDDLLNPSEIFELSSMPFKSRVKNT